ncbi:Gfo/Idh/MocA family protein [Segetibacter aerophilus]|uniref:Deoxyfructose oxidoreductase n=1 Tax=Segetibacter aerophilus TaxID=670293 RepID=A0A512B7G3_9BACT|nr:Gfo/Idh/MocA family oxidoreductase [Segetibacter aerophilus]GEO07911.1 deoxyfructose oxidoreductase [Segetibacter aerophilus]
MKKVRWGILSTAKIGREKVIPGMQASAFCDIAAIASRNIEDAQAVANKLGISKAYGSYEALLDDQDIDAVYIPLPNQLHVPWALKALEANKHVLCEKPIGLTAAEAQQLLKAVGQKLHLKVMEAFMYRFHPQWQYAKEMVMEGKIGDLKTIQSFFSYYNDDPNNIRNQKEAGGGGLMDIGCYCISLSRFIFDKEPARVMGKVEYDKNFGVDQMASGVLDFGFGTSTFTCSTQLTPFQRVNILGTTVGIEIEIPFNAPTDAPTKVWVHSKQGKKEIIFDIANQYTLQGDLFSQAILNDTPVPTPLEDAVNNMKAIEAIFESSDKGRWIELG